MNKIKFIFYIIALLILLKVASAATIHGTVYDFSLNKVKNAKVEIDTSPNQLKIAGDGTYSFDVANGDYTITAKLESGSAIAASTKENITIKGQGSYVLDLILLPDIEEGVEELEFEVGEEYLQESQKPIIWIGIVILLIVVIAALSIYLKNLIKDKKFTSKREDNETKEEGLDSIIDIIKKDGGRTTQKELRKQIPLSEAKISLMIAELEHKGIVDKIKKGRGNILILKK